MNLQDEKATQANDRWDFNMLRASLLLDLDQAIDKTPIGPISFKVIARMDRELMTNYLRRLQDLSRSGINQLGANGGPGDNMKEDIYDNTEIREWYVDMQPFERLQLRIGKQQIVWGETDFFRAMDIVHGYDYRWRMFMEPENEELRKPLIMVNARIQVPELDGSLQLFLRPGLDRDEDIGNTYDINGGRYALSSLKGLDFNSFLKGGLFAAPGNGILPDGTMLAPPNTPVVAYNRRHPDGDASDPTYGARWTGTAGPVGYSFAYLKTFSNDPVENTGTLIGGHPLNGIEPANGALIEVIYPEIDVLGMTLNGYVPLVDAVFSTEVVYTFDQPYNNYVDGDGNVVDDTLATILGFPTSFDFYIPGTRGGGVIMKDKLTTMLRVDKTLAITNKLLGTCNPGFFSVQMVDEWIMNFKESDQIIDLLSFGGPQREHSTLLTSILQLNYRNQTINPMLAVGWDMSYQGTFFFPSIEFVLGNHWRARLEANFFFNQHEKWSDAERPSTSVVGLNPRPQESSAHLLDYLANNDSLLLRLTYQF